ncbi:MAG: hypothetical protein JSR66_08290 [Proteobacteria bacterium]|nr:hypothetical protein [Pseudomonadota bacterium]
MRRGSFNAMVLGALFLSVATVFGAVPAISSTAGVSAARPASSGATVAPTSSAAFGTLPNVDACVARLDPQLDIGYDRIAARCPDLMRQLESGPWAPWMPRGWKEPGNDLSAGSLKEFRALVDRESAARDSTTVEAPDVRSLQPILAALAGGHSETGWTRFKSWLRSILERREQPTDESWFARMVSHIGVSQTVIRLIIYAALAGVVAMAGMIVVNELRTAGLFSTRRNGERKRPGQSANSVVGLSWSAIEQAPLRDRPRLLLDAIVRRLSDRGILPPAGALTVRELTRAAGLPEAEDQSRLAELALATEWVRYSDSRVQVVAGPGSGARADSLDQPIARGRELLNRLDGVPG